MARGISIQITGDARQLAEALRGAGADIERFERKASDSGGRASGALSKIGTGAAVAGAAVVSGGAIAGVALGKLGFDAFQSASTMNESLSKVGVVFGSTGQEIISWSAGASKNLGMSQSAALEAAGVFGNLFRAMEVGERPSADMSKGLVQLGADLASFNNADPTEVMEALRSGLTGEIEPLRKFGVNLTQARIEAEALALGLAKPGEELSAGAKAQAAYSLIMKDTQLAQGDLARTSDSAANKQRQLGAQFDDLKTKIGQGLLPAGQAVLGWLSDLTTNLGPAADQLGAWFSGLGQAFQSGNLGQYLSDALSKIGEWISTWVQANGPMLLQKGQEILKTLVEAWHQGRIWLLERLGDWIPAIGEWVQNTMVPFVQAHWQEWVSAFVEWVGPMAQQLLGKLGEFLVKVGGWFVTDWIPWLYAKQAEIIVAFVGWVGRSIPDLVAKLGEWLQQLGAWFTGTALPWFAAQAPVWLEAFGRWLTDAIANLPGQLLGIVTAMQQWLVGSALPWLVEQSSQLLGAFIGWLADLIPQLPGKLWDVAYAIGEWISTSAVPWLIDRVAQFTGAFFSFIGPAIGEVPSKIGELVGAMRDAIGSAASGLFDTVKDAFRNAINWIIRAWNNFHLDVPSIDAFGVTIGGQTIDTPNIPELAGGGIVPATRGGRLAVLGEGGRDEAVVPLDGRTRVIGGDGGSIGDVHVHLHVEGSFITSPDRFLSDAADKVAMVLRDRERAFS